MKEEWKSLLSSTWIKIVMIAIAVIPMAYAGIFLGSMWDPYGNADKIPVAVVNQDKEVSYNGTNLHVGKDLVENLKESKAMNFDFVNQNEADKGLANETYYMIITIPEKFSYNATTLLQEHPEKMELLYATNPGTNYIASKMDETAIRQIKESVSVSVTTTYADTLFSQVKTLSDGLKDAGNGSQQLGNGVDKTVEGNSIIEQNLTTLASSTLSFKEGSQNLNDGLMSYTTGVTEINNGSKDLSLGLQSLQEQSSGLLDGITSLQTGSSALARGVQSYTGGVNEAANGLDTLASNSTTLNNGMKNISQGSTQTKAGSEQVLNGLQTMSYSLNTMLNDESKQQIASLITQGEQIQGQNSSQIASLQKKKDIGTASPEELQSLTLLKANTALLQADNSTIISLQNGLTLVQSGLDKTGTTSDTMGLIQGMTSLNNGINAIDQGINGTQGLKNGLLSYTTGVDNLQSGMSKLRGSSTELQSGADQLQKGTNTMNESAPMLSAGIKTLNNGSSSIYEGTSALVKNNPKLLNGITQLNDGSTQISDGANQLANGSKVLGNGLYELKNGSSKLTTSLQDGARKSSFSASEETKEMMAQPLNVTHEETAKVESNGKAMAPYMMSVGLYVACMAFTLMYPLLKNNSKTKSGLNMWLSKASIMYALSTVMAVIMILALTLINGLSPLQFVKTLGIAVLISAAFMSMIVFFNITCGKIGAFLVLIFMVFQLGGAAGTYPIETSNGFYQAIHPFMPFTYSVDAFRHTLALGGTILPECIVFVGMILVFSACSILFYRWRVSISEEQYAKTKLAQFQ